MTMPSDEAVAVTLGEPGSRTALLLEAIALRHQIAVLKRSGTRRPCFRVWDRLFWILLSWWWPHWREALLIVQPETVVRWRRDVWSTLWRYRSGGRWRGELRSVLRCHKPCEIGRVGTAVSGKSRPPSIESCTVLWSKAT